MQFEDPDIVFSAYIIGWCVKRIIILILLSLVLILCLKNVGVTWIMMTSFCGVIELICADFLKLLRLPIDSSYKISPKPVSRQSLSLVFRDPGRSNEHARKHVNKQTGEQAIKWTSHQKSKQTSKMNIWASMHMSEWFNKCRISPR